MTIPTLTEQERVQLRLYTDRAIKALDIIDEQAKELSRLRALEASKALEPTGHIESLNVQVKELQLKIEKLEALKNATEAERRLLEEERHILCLHVNDLADVEVRLANATALLQDLADDDFTGCDQAGVLAFLADQPTALPDERDNSAKAHGQLYQCEWVTPKLSRFEQKVAQTTELPVTIMASSSIPDFTEAGPHHHKGQHCTMSCPKSTGESWTGKPGLPEREVLARSAAEYAQIIEELENKLNAALHRGTDASSQAKSLSPEQFYKACYRAVTIILIGVVDCSRPEPTMQWNRPTSAEHCLWMLDQANTLYKEGKMEKAFWGLGYTHGAIIANGWATVDELEKEVDDLPEEFDFTGKR